MTDQQRTILQTTELVCGYDAPLLGPLDLSLDAGDFVLVEGPNGIGKSALVKTFVGLIEPLSGSYEWAVDDKRLRFVPQVRTLDPILPATVADVVATGSQQGSGLAGMRVSASESEIGDALERVEMAGHRRDLFRELSEGQKQLVLLARALLGDARALLLDEPTASMDPRREKRAVGLLRRECDERGRTVLMIAHGSEHARRAADAAIEIDRDRRVEVLPLDD